MTNTIANTVAATIWAWSPSREYLNPAVVPAIWGPFESADEALADALGSGWARNEVIILAI